MKQGFSLLLLRQTPGYPLVAVVRGANTFNLKYWFSPAVTHDEEGVRKRKSKDRLWNKITALRLLVKEILKMCCYWKKGTKQKTANRFQWVQTRGWSTVQTMWGGLHLNITTAPPPSIPHALLIYRCSDLSEPPLTWQARSRSNDVSWLTSVDSSRSNALSRRAGLGPAIQIESAQFVLVGRAEERDGETCNCR